MQELATDAAIKADPAGHVVNVCADLLAQVCHFVDKGDLHREEGVGGIFGQFSGFDRGEYNGGLDQVQRAVEPAHHLPCSIRFRADDYAVGTHEVADGIALAQEFGIGRDVEIEVGAGQANYFLDVAASADRHGRLGDDDRIAGESFGDLLGGGIDICQVGMTVAAPCRCTDRDKHRLGAIDRGGEIAGEGQPASSDVVLHELFEAGFVNRHPPSDQRLQLLGFGFDNSDLGAELGETGAGDQADIAAANHGYTHVGCSLCGCEAHSAQDGGVFQKITSDAGSPAPLDTIGGGLDVWSRSSQPGIAMPNTTLRVGIAGAGHFGRYHALKVAASSRTVLSGIHDPDLERAKTVGWEAGAKEVGFEDLLELSDAVIVAAPAEVHYELAARALRAGKHVLVEKPITATLAQADALGALAAERELVLQVGHLERFSAAYQTMAGRIGAPLYIEATRIAPFKPRGTDVSVILDLMIHDLDLVLALVDSEIESVDAVGAPVASAHEDIANARLRFRSGAVATITASRISPRTERRMRIFAQNSYMAADFSTRRLTVIGRASDGGLPTGQAAVPGLAGLAIEEVAWEDHDSLMAEHAAFVASVLDGAPVLVDAAVGRRALAAALSVGESMRAARARMTESGLIRAG